MNICFASYDGIPLTKGGPYVKIIETKKYFEKEGHSVTLFNMWQDYDKMGQFDIVNLFGANFAIYGLARNLYQKNINFVVEPIFFSNHSEKFLRSVNSIDENVRKHFKGIWFDYGIIRDICNWSRLILPNTAEEKKILSEGFKINSEKFKVVPNGVSQRFMNGDPDLFTNKFGIKDFILYVGHLGSKRKNGIRLIEALKNIDHKSVIIGDISKTHEGDLIRSEAEKNKNILMLDPLENDSDMLASVYAACDTFVLPSEFETPGIAALEAALAGAKIVITPFGGTKDYFKEMAEYVDPRSTASIRTAIERSLNTPKTEELKNFIKDNFLWEKVAQLTLEAYKSVI